MQYLRMAASRIIFPQDFIKRAKFFKQVSVYQKAVLPIIYTLRIFGLYPYQKLSSGEIYLRRKTTVFLYSTVLYLFQLYIVAETIWNSYGNYKLKKVDLVQLYIIACLSFIIICTSPLIWITSKNLENFFHEWMIFQTKYNNIIHPPLQSKGEKCILLKNAIIFVCSYLLYFWVVDILDFTWYHVVFSIMCILFQSLFMTLCVLTKWSFQFVMNHYKNVLKTEINSKPITIQVMEEYRLIWIFVSKLVQKFGTCFSLMLTLHLILHSVMFVLLVYKFVGLASYYVRLEDYGNFLKLFTAPWIPFMMTFVCCNIGHLITKHCTENIPELVIEMKSKLLIFRSDNTVSIKLFLYAINDFKPTVNVLGYFEINRPLFGSIISVLVTYMIVLVQFGNN